MRRDARSARSVATRCRLRHGNRRRRCFRSPPLRALRRGESRLTDQRPESRCSRLGRRAVTLVAGDEIDETALALRDTLDVDWQHAPFTRCILDNEPLEPAPPHFAMRVPERSRAAGGPFRVCRACGRLYWPGGHVRRMQQRLAKWQNAPASKIPNGMERND